MRTIHSFRLVVIGAVVAACTVGSVGCATDGYVEASVVPPSIETQPYVYYDGHPTYFSGDRWYYRNGDRWVYYRSEPAELHRQRAFVVRPGAVHVTAAPGERHEEGRGNEREHEEHR